MSEFDLHENERKVPRYSDNELQMLALNSGILLVESSGTRVISCTPMTNLSVTSEKGGSNK